MANSLRDQNRITTLLAVSTISSTTALNVNAIPLTGANALTVAIVDGDGTQITSFGGGTQYADGAARGTATGTLAMGDDGTNIQSVHVDSSGDLQIDVLTMPSTAVTNAGLTELAAAINASSQMDVNIAASGATVPISHTALTELAAAINSNLVDVNIVSGAGSGGTASADDADFTAGTTNGTPAMGVYESVPTSVTDNDMGIVGITVNRRLKTSATIDAALPAGTNAIGKLAANSGVDIGDVDITSIAAGNNNIGDVDVASIAAGDNNIGNVDIVSGTITTVTTVSTVSALGVSTTGPQKAEDVASAGGDMGILMMASRLDTPVANAGVSNDGDYTNPILDNFRKLWVTGTVPEDTAHVAGEAILQGGVRRIDTAATSAGSSGDWATMDASAEGAIWATLTPTTTSGLSVGNFTSGDTYTALTSTAQVIKASAGNLYGYYIYNPNSSATYVLIYNIAAASVTVGTSTALLVFAIPATSAANLMFSYPITFSNAGWSIAAATTGGGNSAPATALEAMVFYK